MKNFNEFLNESDDHVLSTHEVHLNDGEYDGLWSGYHLEILVPNSPSIEIKTIDGVRGMNCKQKLRIKDHKVYRND